MDVRDTILTFEDVSIAAQGHQMTGVTSVSFGLAAGDTVLITVEEGRERLPLPDAAEGLLAPDTGKVRFGGESWAGMGPHQQTDRRGTIRRVFADYGWISNLDVLENVCLAECHHTRRHEAEIVAEARGLARRFGMADIPEGRPSRIHSQMLRKLEWVRALLGSPRLIILERPLFGAPKADAPLFVQSVCEAAEKGAAVLWLTDEPRVWECDRFKSVQRFRMDGDKLCAA